MFEAVILAGGFGTRLREVVRDIPKPMASIKDKPFLYYLFKYLKRNEIKRIILAVSYRSDVIIEYFKDEFEGIKIIYSIEEKPLGTGGGIKKAFEYTESENIFVLNGDTYFNISLRDLYEFHKNKKAEISLALKLVDKPDRYGIVKLNEEGEITGFLEKRTKLTGPINGGIYLINKKAFLNFAKRLPENFSFEKDVLETLSLKTYGKIYYNYFIDIGVPEDYEKAKRELPDI
ncbi:MAG: nucleotidyltransferase family protein [Nitrososphaeria archaeon]